MKSMTELAGGELCLPQRVAAFSPLANSPPAISPASNGPPAKSPPPAAIRPPLAYNSMSITFLLIH